MLKVAAALAVATFLSSGTLAASEAGSCPVIGTRPLVAEEVLAPHLLRGRDGEVRLAGIIGGEAAESTDREVIRAALPAGPLTLAEAGQDRYGRPVGQVFAGTVWVQEALVSSGLARAAPEAASAPCDGLLLKAEAGARARRTGRWGSGEFAVLPPERSGARPGTYQIVEGVVQDASVVRGRAFVNFGADRRTDFTVTVAPADMKTFRATTFDIAALTGKRVRVRGWIELYNGPEIVLTQPAAIEILE